MRREAEVRVLSGEVRILLAAPERLRSLEFCLLLKRSARGAGVSLVVVEEAHCISEWGRPAWSEPSPSGLSLAISAASSTGRTPARSSARRPSRNRKLSCRKFGPTLWATLLAELSELEYLNRDRPERYPA